MIQIINKQKIGLVALFLLISFGVFIQFRIVDTQGSVSGVKTEKEMHWFMLYRKSNIEKLYYGVPNDESKSKLIKTFKVKSGIPGKKPTPLHSLFGREYWKIIDKVEAFDNEETAPYFLTLDVPVSEKEPFGPTPYLECDGQCNWELPGYFGLHGTASDEAKISDENVGSSGCIRHSDEDIDYLYNLLNPKNEEIRYYIQDI